MTKKELEEKKRLQEERKRELNRQKGYDIEVQKQQQATADELYNKLKADPDHAKDIITDFTHGMVTHKMLQKFRQETDAGYPTSTVVNDTFGTDFFVWFKEMENNTKEPTGFDVLKPFVNFIIRENGGIVHTYHTTPQAHAGHPWQVGTDSTGKRFIQWTTEDRDANGKIVTQKWMERYNTKYTVRLHQMQYNPLPENTHKRTADFLAQFMDRTTYVKQPNDEILLSLYALILANPAHFDESINEDLNNDDNQIIGLNASTLDTPTWTLEINSLKDLVVKLNTFISHLTTPTFDHYPVGSTSDKLMTTTPTGDTVPRLKRAVTMDTLRILADPVFLNTYNAKLIASVFQKGEGSFYEQFGKSIRSVNMDEVFGGYGNIQGIKNNMQFDDTGKALSGEFDILLTTDVNGRMPFGLIGQYNAVKTFDNPDLTSAFNMLYNLGKDVCKDNDMIWGWMRITVANPPQQSSKSGNPKE